MAIMSIYTLKKTFEVENPLFHPRCADDGGNETKSIFMVGRRRNQSRNHHCGIKNTCG